MEALLVGLEELPQHQLGGVGLMPLGELLEGGIGGESHGCCGGERTARYERGGGGGSLRPAASFKAPGSSLRRAAAPLVLQRLWGCSEAPEGRAGREARGLLAPDPSKASLCRPRVPPHEDCSPLHAFLGGSPTEQYADVHRIVQSHKLRKACKMQVL